jgi:hypothetical protein
MGRFEDFITRIREGDRVETSHLLATMKKEQCICPGCPVLSECSKERGESLYCFLGKGLCEYNGKEPGCICPVCPVIDDYGLKGINFCGRGSEMEQRKLQ